MQNVLFPLLERVSNEEGWLRHQKIVPKATDYGADGVVS